MNNAAEAVLGQEKRNQTHCMVPGNMTTLETHCQTKRLVCTVAKNSLPQKKLIASETAIGT